MSVCVHAVNGCVFWIALTIIICIDESMAVHFFFFYVLYGITHGFDITLNLLLMAWNFNDILRFVFEICMSNTHCPYNFYFTHNVTLTELQWIIITLCYLSWWAVMRLTSLP